MSSSIWVGETGDKVLVFDPALQIEESPHVYLWNVHTHEMSTFQTDIIKRHIKSFRDVHIAKKYISAYQRWILGKGETWKEAWKDEHRKYLRSLQETKQRVVEQHEEHLKKLGKDYKGIRTTGKNLKHRRVAHCFSCKEKIDNSINLECVSCGWILCMCGACGCQFAIQSSLKLDFT